ncbi:PQQ-binding-like beta-propeller repeat protein [Virgisporangium aurantiacum]|uniref:Uncharacterized protein n=1 Tax=Virgisporangium aurantiacum TaxID=175570 RepID=A0A8J3ZNP0_9ACTN|nr:PQQ-binding-like beta-propeller repeat protein [Virgisporangium aurantiacum]GIJ64881.1 hypothetical protein Vau01_123970 [Virgisporangium aurantiacum]
MRPTLIGEVTVAEAGWITFHDGIGWLVHHRTERAVTVLGPDLRSAVRIDVPVALPLRASVSTRHLAAVTLDELVVCDRQGTPLWRRELVIRRGGLPCEPNCHLDSHGVLWVYLPDGDELVAYDAGSGEEIARVGLDSSVGAAQFWPHPDGRRLGFHVAMGQDTPLSHLARLADGRITGRNLPGGFLTGFDSTGDRYLAMPHAGGELSIRDLTTGDPVVSGQTDDRPLMEAAAFVSDGYVLVALDTDDGYEDHVLLSAATLSPCAEFHYGLPMQTNSIAATDGRGRWITHGHREDAIRLWQLPDPVDAVPGQQQLW